MKDDERKIGASPALGAPYKKGSAVMREIEFRVVLAEMEIAKANAVLDVFKKGAGPYSLLAASMVEMNHQSVIEKFRRAFEASKMEPILIEPEPGASAHILNQLAAVRPAGGILAYVDEATEFSKAQFDEIYARFAKENPGAVAVAYEDIPKDAVCELDLNAGTLKRKK